MRNTKLWSVLLAAVLLCACIVGVLFVGAQAEGTAYYMTVGDADGAYATKVTDKTFIANYADINAAVKAAKSAKTDWAPGDTLTIYVTQTPTDATAANATSRFIFVGDTMSSTVFRSDNTKLPIIIDGDDPSTEAVEKTNGFDLNGTGYSGTGNDLQCTNDYTFRNLTLPWTDAAKKTYFRSGSAQVTFDNVDFGATKGNLVISADCSTQVAVRGWTVDQWNANADENGIVTTSLTFKNTAYGGATGYVGAKQITGGFTVSDGYALAGKGLSNMRSKIVVQEGATIANLHVFIDNYSSGNGYSGTGNNRAYEYVIDIQGGSVSTLWGQRNQTKASGNIIVNMSGGTLGSGYIGQSNATATIANNIEGNITYNLTGGTATNLYGIRQGNLKGTLTFNVSGNFNPTGFKIAQSYANIDNVVMNFDGVSISSWASVPHMVSGITVTNLHNKFNNCHIGKEVYLGQVSAGTVTNIENTLTGTIDTNDGTVFLGASSGVIKGNITNHIACAFTNGDAAATPSLNGGSWGATIEGKITNYIEDGAVLGEFIAGNRTGDFSEVETYISGGTIKHYFGGGGYNCESTIAPTIKNVVTGGTITYFCGASMEANNAVAKVENFIGEVKEDGTYAGDAWIATYFGGKGNLVVQEKTPVGVIENTFYSGTIGAADRSDAKTWHGDSKIICGSSHGSVGVIRNYFYGGNFNAGYTYGGNMGSTSSFATTVAAPAAGESQVNNFIYGGHFARFNGASNGCTTATVSNVLDGANAGAISVREGACYLGGGATSATTVNNTISGFAPVSLGDAGVITDATDLTSTTIYGGGNSDAVGTVINTIKNDAVIKNFYAACNGGYAKNVSTTITKDAGSAVAPQIEAYKGLSRVAGGETDTESIINTVEAGTIGTYHGACGSLAQGGSIGSITNNITGGTITGTFVGGCNEVAKPAASVTEKFDVEIGSITNNIGSDSFATRPLLDDLFYGGNYKQPSLNGNASKIYGTFVVGEIVNTFDYVLMDGNAYLGDRYNTVNNITNTINNLQVTGTIYLGNNVGKVTGDVVTTINGLTLGGKSGSNAKFIPDVGSANVDTATFKVIFAEDAVIDIDAKAVFNLTPNNAKSVITVEGSLVLNQLDGFWADGTVYANVPEDVSVTATGDASGSLVRQGTMIVGKSALTAVEANFILTERVAIRIVFDKPVLSEYTAQQLVALVGGNNVKIEVDPTNANAVIIYGIGLVDFDKQITFGGYLPALASSIDSVIELSDYAVGKVANDDIYKAIVDFGRAYAGAELKYNLEAAEVTNKATQPAIDPSKLEITGKNLVMHDALGFRYYATLVGDTTIEDIKVSVEGTDYTDYCNIAFVEGSKTEITIDFYLGIKVMKAPIDVKIEAGDTVALEYVDYGDAICQKIITAQPENALAKAALVYIQTAAKL